MTKLNLREGVRDDGTVEGRVIETHFRPLKFVELRHGYLCIVVDDDATDIETRMPTELLVELGWTPPGPADERARAGEAAAREVLTGIAVGRLAFREGRPREAMTSESQRIGWDEAQHDAGVGGRDER